MRRALVASLAAVVVGLACGDPTEGTRQVVEVAFTSDGAGTPVTLGANTLTITRAELVVRRIKITADSADCDEHDDGRDHCVEILFGPALAILPLASGFNTAFSGLAPQGNYRRIEFKLHQPATEPGDTAFIAGNPDFSHSSIVVEGTWNGAPFQFTTALSQTIRVDLDPVAAVDGPHAKIVVNVDVTSWFRSNAGLIDPSTGNVGGTHETLVRANILKSITASASP